MPEAELNLGQSDPYLLRCCLRFYERPVPKFIQRSEISSFRSVRRGASSRVECECVRVDHGDTYIAVDRLPDPSAVSTLHLWRQCEVPRYDVFRCDSP